MRFDEEERGEASKLDGCHALKTGLTVAQADKDGTSPGKEVLSKLLERFGPAVVLMDETVAYLRQLEHGKSYKGGTYNSNLSFGKPRSSSEKTFSPPP